MSVHKYREKLSRMTQHWKSSAKVHELTLNSTPEGSPYTDIKYRKGFCIICITVATQVVVPKEYRDHMMKMTHASIVGEHVEERKTAADRITSSRHLQRIMSDVTCFCRRCDICRRVVPKGNVTRVPFGEMPRMEEPFSRVAMDVIGPLSPGSDK